MSFSIPHVPVSIDETGSFIDIYSYLLGNRIIFLSDEIDKNVANSVISQVLFLEALDNKEDIRIYINSQGGDLNACFAIIDTLDYVKSPVRTVCLGEAFSSAAVILASGNKGKRVATKNSVIMLHEPWSSFIGSASEHENYFRHFERQKKKVINHLCERTGICDIDMFKILERDKYLSSEEALELGIIDEILKK